MAPVARYQLPHEQLHDLAVKARCRGLSFEEFWEEAVRPNQSVVSTRTEPRKRPPGAVIWPSDTADRALCRIATREAKEVWRRAYELAPPTPGERALAFLAAALIDDGMESLSAVA